jgi:hypothetical protein
MILENIYYKLQNKHGNWSPWSTGRLGSGCYANAVACSVKAGTNNSDEKTHSIAWMEMFPFVNSRDLCCRKYKWGYETMSRIASVRCGSTSGSLSIGRQERGPSFRYVFKKDNTAGLRFPSSVSSSIRMTVSGDKSPWAVGKEGSVSQLARTELESLVRLFLGASFTRGVPGFFNMFCAVMWAGFDAVGVVGSFFRLWGVEDRNTFWFVDQADVPEKKNRRKSTARNILDESIV